MTRYSSLLERRVEVVYRIGTVPLLAVGMLLADSGEFIFVGQRLDQQDSTKAFQLKIPYHCIVQLNGK
jgi:hypothetical protein